MDTRRGESTLDASNGHDSIASESAYSKLVKPAFDRLFGAVLLIIAIPLLAVIAVFVVSSIGRPIFYSQTRIGHKGEPFQLHKFRTMLPDRRQGQNGYDGQDRRFNHKSSEDPRHTNIGRVLRSSRLDELPQLWNVVKGDMSLVGPRPEVPSEVAKYEDWQHRRHVVKPGITGLWQISEQNGKPMRDCTEIDLEYLERIGFFEDMRILLRTPLAMLGKKRGR